MAIFSKISRLNRIPQLLNQKREAEMEEKRKKREDSSERPPFRQFINTVRPEPKHQSYSEAVDPDTARARRQGIGRRIDVFA